MIIPITFSFEVKESVLALFDKAIDAEGFIVEAAEREQRVPTPEGEFINVAEWGGIVRGSEAFIKSDEISLLGVAKRTLR